MLGKHTITNLLLLFIAAALLLTVAQGGLAQSNPLINASEDETKDPESLPLSFGERLLEYVLLIWALALGVEAGVEFIRMFLDPRRGPPHGPGPTEILKPLNPWLPKPGDIPPEELEKEREKKKEEEEKQEADKGKDDTSQETPGWWLEEQRKALSGIVQVRKDDDEKRDWTGIFKELALWEKEYLENKEKRLRQNRAISLGIAIGLAILTGVNTFHILLGPEAEKELGDWYTVGGIALSAFAATAGSAVWHDLLDKLRQSKEESPEQEEKE